MKSIEILISMRQLALSYHDHDQKQKALDQREKAVERSKGKHEIVDRYEVCLNRQQP